MEDKFVLGGKEFKSRFILGSGKYNLNLIKAAVEQGGAEIIRVSPGSKNTWEPPMLAAYSETVTVSSKEICLDESASKIRSSVIILVTLAGCLASWEFFS